MERYTICPFAPDFLFSIMLVQFIHIIAWGCRYALHGLCCILLCEHITFSKIHFTILLHFCSRFWLSQRVLLYTLCYLSFAWTYVDILAGSM